MVVLGHSRLLWLRFYRRQTMAVLIDGLESAFARFGGVPAELLFDQMRAVVLSDDRAGGGELVLNAEFLRSAAHWGFVPHSCRPYRAQTKGKVERPIRYLRENFFYGRAFVNDEVLNEQAARWLEGTANVRRHGTTGERPADRFERDERAALRPSAGRPYRRLGAGQASAAAPRPPIAVEVESQRGRAGRASHSNRTSAFGHEDGYRQDLGELRHGGEAPEPATLPRRSGISVACSDRTSARLG